MKTEEKATFAAQLSEILFKHGVITQEEAKAMQHAFEQSAIDQFDDFLISEGLVEQGDLLEALSEYFEVPSFDVVGYFFERHLLHMFPKQMLIRNRMIPLEVDENMMIIVTSNPDNPDILAQIGENVSYDIRFYVGIGQDIINAIQEFYDKADTEVSDEGVLPEDDLIMGEIHFSEDDEGMGGSIEGSYEEDFDTDLD